MIWGANFVVVKSALALWPAPAFNAARCVFAAGVMLVMLFYIDRRHWLPRKDWRALVVLGAVWNGGYQILFILALRRIPASDTALIFATMPVMVALWRRVVAGERLAAWQ